MNIILANLRTTKPAVHRADISGNPMCGATHSAVIPFIGPNENKRRQKLLMEAEADERQFEMSLTDARKAVTKKEAAPITKVKPNEEYIQDIGDVTCKACLLKMKKEINA